MTDLRNEFHTLVDKLFDVIEGSSADDWVDQKASPLGRARHCELVRSGKIKGVKEGRRVMVRRSDIEAYLAKHAVVRVDASADESAEVARVKAILEKKSRAA